MKFIDSMVVVVVVFGALNWGLGGLLQFDLVAALLGDATLLSRFVNILVGAAGLFLVLQWKVCHDRQVGLEKVTADLAVLRSTGAGQRSDEGRNRSVLGTTESR